MMEKLQRFMRGRYGWDIFGQFLTFAALVLFFLGMLTWRIFYWLGLAALVFSYYRMFSRNIEKRRSENEWYLRTRAALVQKIRQLRRRFALRRTYKYFLCPECGQELRIPRGRGKVSIHCPKCGKEFTRKS